MLVVKYQTEDKIRILLKYSKHIVNMYELGSRTKKNIRWSWSPFTAISFFPFFLPFPPFFPLNYFLFFFVFFFDGDGQNIYVCSFETDISIHDFPRE